MRTQLATPLLALCTAACGPSLVETARRSARPYEITEVEVHGVERFDEATLLSYLDLGESSPWPWGETHRYGEALVRTDAERIRQLYLAYGYFQAEVLGIEIHPVADDEAHVVVRVSEGPPILVASTTVDGVEPVSVRSLPKPGDPFDPERLAAAREALLADLRDRGHGLASVVDSAQVDPGRGVADVRLEVLPGPVVTIGDVRIEGLVEVPEAPVLEEARFAVGRRYRPSLVERVEQSVYSLDVFSSVVCRLLEPGPDGRAVLLVRVAERASSDLKLGVGFGFQPLRWDERVGARYRHRNLFGTLTGLRVDVRVGWAELPTPWAPRQTGPLATVAPSLDRKDPFGLGLLWTLAPSFDLGLEDGYRWHRERGQIGASRFFLGKLRAGLRHTVERFDFFHLDPTLDRNLTQLGRDFRDPYVLSYPTLDLRLFLADDLFDPHDGVVLGATWDLAGGPFGGDFSFHQLRPSVAGYWHPGPIQLAARAELGLLLPYGAEAGVPISRRLRLGGANTVRGFGADRLSPQVRDCAGCAGIPVGGRTLVLGNLEVRVPIVHPVELAAFIDVGDVQEAELTWRPDQWQYAAGGGLRAVTPVGRLRLDAAARLNGWDRFPEEPSWGLHLALGEAF